MTSSGTSGKRGGRNAQPTCSEELVKPVFFVGFMGAGKTTIARRLARDCHLAAVDMDSYIERREGKKVKEIFAESGEEGFRAIETAVLREFCEGDPLLVSCGGGVVVRPENRALLESGAGFVVHLKVSADEAARRISDTSSRPLFQDIDSARARCLEREPLYDEVADVSIQTAGRSVNSIAGEVRKVLREKGILCPRR